MDFILFLQEKHLNLRVKPLFQGYKANRKERQDSELRMLDSQAPLPPTAYSPAGRPHFSLQLPKSSFQGPTKNQLCREGGLVPHSPLFLLHTAVTFRLVHTQPWAQMPLAGFLRTCSSYHATERNVGTWKVVYFSAQYGAWHRMKVLCVYSHVPPHHSAYHIAFLSPPTP